MKLSRILSNQNGVSRKQANLLIAAGMVTVNDLACRDASREVDRFATVACHGRVILKGRRAHYLMLNKPAGYLSATTDDTHRTVMELVNPELRKELHIAGRLDRASTGLLILTNDGNWSRNLTEPRIKTPKVYRVTTAYPVSADAIRRFEEGIWFDYEQLTTSPAQLEPISDTPGVTESRVTIYEGRYHQIKRMFHATGNRVTSLHRERVGDIALDPQLAPGHFRPLTRTEVISVKQTAPI